MKFPELSKHPIVVVIIAVTYFFILQSTIGKTNMQSEINGAYKELQISLARIGCADLAVAIG